MTEEQNARPAWLVDGAEVLYTLTASDVAQIEPASEAS